MRETSKVKKTMGVMGIILAVGYILAGGIILLAAQSTSIMAAKMIEARSHVTKMIDYTCDTCGLTGSIAEGTSSTHDGTECGYISGQAVRCKGRYKTNKREMTAEEKKEIEADIDSFKKMRAKASSIGMWGGLSVIAGILMIIGAAGSLKNQPWGLPVIGVTFIAGIISTAMGFSVILTTYSSY